MIAGIIWYAWLLIAAQAFVVLAQPFFIGKTRVPLTAKDCCYRTVIAALEVWAIVELAT